jgi:hypothetical protein
MALQFETGTPSSVEDLVNKLQTFAAAHNFTVDNYDATNDECTIHESNMYVHFGWDGTGTDLNICQSLGYTPATAIDVMPNDSGNGSATIGIERRVEFLAAGPWTSYEFYCEDGAGGDPMYIHVVVQISAGIYRHFGFGTIDKINDWTGGEYAYGHIWEQGATNIDSPASVSHVFVLDGTSSPSLSNATMHMEGIGLQGGSEKWGVFGASVTGTDTAGQTRRVLFGGSRDGLWLRFMRHIHNSNLNSYIPIIPIPVVYRDTGTAPDTWIWLGQQPNVGIVNMNNLSAGDTITLGGETWVVYPWARKQHLLANTEESWNAGIVYRKS